MIEFNQQTIETDKQGYLLDYTIWTPALGEYMAGLDNIVLTPEHWEVINFVRAFYLTYNTSPAIRALTKAMKAEFGEEKASSRYLYRLFKEGPAKQATKYAGLPKPARCI
ncbi:TusE/DsrC/DsvC family sulfur relay protein [Thalassotalea sp. LPB0316]|uniref:TusE/DsrC/DsvC family sulfur relay protein n=1 Tax=Thalassotalea sp. LPB0316 TaxID=2769490 RepID=UPI001868C154|nr:TusE/DsrC/DsvC family sulfur relay protein [Thalassotalea sp. LPB0316]QOL27319.1 TusE/DsrC/DsvC family sulfur relay protein [Thalassotalea sp. LPB0316]